MEKEINHTAKVIYSSEDVIGGGAHYYKAKSETTIDNILDYATTLDADIAFSHFLGEEISKEEFVAIQKSKDFAFAVNIKEGEAGYGTAQICEVNGGSISESEINLDQLLEMKKELASLESQKKILDESKLIEKEVDDGIYYDDGRPYFSNTPGSVTYTLKKDVTIKQVNNRLLELKQDIKVEEDIINVKNLHIDPEEFDDNEIIQDLNSYFKTLSKEDNLIRYLNTVATFPKYSPYNTALIIKQMPDAVRIEGEKTWAKLGHEIVDKSGITILAPRMEDRETQQQKKDPKTKQPIFDSNGHPVTETVLKKVLTGFDPITVYDVSQTVGKPIPESPKYDNDTLYKALIGDKSADNTDKEKAIKSVINDIAAKELKTENGTFTFNCAVYAIRSHFGIDTSDINLKGNNFDNPDKIKNVLEKVNKAVGKTISEIEEKCVKVKDVEKVNLSKSDSNQTEQMTADEKDVSEDIININNIDINKDNGEVFYRFDDLGDKHTDDKFSETVELRNALKTALKRAETAEKKCTEQEKLINEMRSVINRTNNILKTNPKLLADFKKAKSEYLKSKGEETISKKMNSANNTHNKR